MSTLLIHLAAPIQSWGIDSKFDTRRTAREPSKSGVVGLLSAAMGIKRNEDEKIATLASLRFGVRVDKEGTLMRDFHTARDTRKKQVVSYVTNRYYLMDAVFVVGLEGSDKKLLEQMEKALNAPAFPLYLGRRSCPPVGKLSLGIYDCPLEEALKAVPIQAEGQHDIRMVVDTDTDEIGSIVKDMPVSFNPENRQYTFRQIREEIINFNCRPTEHDPMEELG